jgi:hypothetical protein
MRAHRWILAAALALTLGTAMATTAMADELQMPNSDSASADRPARGLTMDKVEAKFGAPSRRVPAVGEPPITRWEYPGFVVFFERDRVLHTVTTG